MVGDNNFTFTTPFAWDGTSNVAVQFCFDNPALVDAAADVMEGTSGPLASGNYPSLFSNYQTAPSGSGCS